MAAAKKTLKSVNSNIKKIDVKGKGYVLVNDRVLAFRELYPKGFIRTELVSLEDNVCIFKTSVGIGEEVLATGYAYEKENSTFINKTSYIENCETSSVGRALGMLGIGIDTSIASAEEVTNAINNQQTKAVPKSMTKGDVKECELLRDDVSKAGVHMFDNLDFNSMTKEEARKYFLEMKKTYKSIYGDENAKTKKA